MPRDGAGRRLTGRRATAGVRAFLRPYVPRPRFERGNRRRACAAGDDRSCAGDHRIGSLFGSIAAGADILFCEAALDAGCALHVVLPIPLPAFLAQSVRPFGEAWRPRAEACLDRARSIRHASEDPYVGDDRVFAYGSRYAAGCAILRARILATRAVQLAVWDGTASRGLAGVVHDIDYWRSTGREPILLSAIVPDRAPPPGVPTGQTTGGSGERAMKTMLFADFQGFERLRDDQLPVFFEAVMARVAAVIDALVETPWLAETWGDGLFLVFDTPEAAAEAGLRILVALAEIELGEHGLPSGLQIRIAGHYGPVHLRTNPVLRTRAAVGTHVVVAARIEPDVAPGAFYVTEAMAAALTASDAGQYHCAYVGRSTERKAFMPVSLFGVRRRALFLHRCVFLHIFRPTNPPPLPRRRSGGDR